MEKLRIEKKMLHRVKNFIKKFFISIVLLFLIAILFNCYSSENEIVSSLSIVSYGGGSYQKSHIESFLKPFEKFTGITMNSITWGAEYGKLKEMVSSGNVPWDVVEVTDAQFKRGKREGLFEKLVIYPESKEFLPNTIDDYGVANVYWGTVMAYSYKEFPDNQPNSWRDFWDIEAFPGFRALYDDPRGNLEFALLADGVDIDSLYPLDVDRAFEKLNLIKDNIRVWWNEGTQPIQLLQNKSIVMTSAWNGRIFALREQEKKIGYTWFGAALELDWWIIPKGSNFVETASRFITFSSYPERMAHQATLIGYGPVNMEALKYIEKDIQTMLPTYQENWNKSFVINAEWWSENETVMMKRWITWKNK